MEHTENPQQHTGFASVAELGAFFRIDTSAVPGLMHAMGVPKRGAGFPWIRVWIAVGVDPGTVQDIDALKQPLLEVKEVAALIGESTRTTRRRGDGEHRDKSIPAHIDLGPRSRRYFPAEIQAWILGETVPFRRKQVNLCFTPANVEGMAIPKPQADARSPCRHAPASAASLFMAPPRPA